MAISGVYLNSGIGFQKSIKLRNWLLEIPLFHAMGLILKLERTFVRKHVSVIAIGLHSVI